MAMSISGKFSHSLQTASKKNTAAREKD